MKKIVITSIFLVFCFACNPPAPTNKATNTPEPGNGQQVAAGGKINCPVVKDTWVYQFKKDKNYGDGRGWSDITDPSHPVTIPKMFLGFGGSDKKLILVQFDLSQLPKDKPVKKATLRLYNDYSGSNASVQVEAKQVLSDWHEMSVTWNTMPKLADTAAWSITLSGAFTDQMPGRWYEWDVTKVVDAWQKGEANYGIALDPVGDSGVDRDFVVREYKEKANYAPGLVVEY